MIFACMIFAVFDVLLTTCRH